VEWPLGQVEVASLEISVQVCHNLILALWLLI
jgi:hypothetical protein